MSIYYRYRVYLVSLLWLGFSGLANAHEPGLSSIHLIMKQNAWEAHIIIDANDFKSLMPAVVIPDQFNNLQAAITEKAATALAIQAAEKALTVTKKTVNLTDRDDLEFIIDFQTPPENTSVKLTALWLANLPTGHKQHFSLLNAEGRTVYSQVLTAEASSAVLNPAEIKPSSFWDKLTPMIFIGVEHIWLGYDHVLFLFGLLVVGMKLVPAIEIITAFTLSHSLTLGLATFEMVNIPSSVVEPLIAATIIYIGVENIVTNQLRWRWLIAFIFGLIHGLGFATALRELGIGTQDNDLWATLLGFNLGVEAGQITIALIVLPLVWWLHQKIAKIELYKKAFSLVIAGFGLYWLVERTLLS